MQYCHTDLNDKHAHKIVVSSQIICDSKTDSIIKNLRIYMELFHYTNKLYLYLLSILKIVFESIK